MSQPALALLICLGALVLEAWANDSERSTFFRPLTCDQDPSHRQKCGGEAERFYPNQCLQKKCCYLNHTCFHHIIDGCQPPGRSQGRMAKPCPRGEGATQRRNAGILGGTCIVVIIFSACLFYGCKFREFQKKEGLSEGPASEGNIDDYLVKLLDDESMAESETQDGTVSLQADDSWAQRRGSKQVGWSPEPLELEELRSQRQWSPEPSLEMSPEPSPEALPPHSEPPLSSEPPLPAPEELLPAPKEPLPAPEEPLPAPVEPPPPSIAESTPPASLDVPTASLDEAP